MKKLSLVLALLALLVTAISCADDIILESPPSLQGEYTGLYSYTKNRSTNPVTEQVAVAKWIFTESGYNMQVDESDDAVAFCSPFGRYTLTDKVELRETQNGCAGTIADASLNPTGEFTLRRPTDSVVLSQLNTDIDAFIEIKLERVPE